MEKYVENFSGNAPGWSFAKLANNALVVAPNSPQTPPLSLVPGHGITSRYAAAAVLSPFS